jgi:hypothetical protein
MRPVLSAVQRQRPGRLHTMAKPRGGNWHDNQMRALRRLSVDIVVCAPSSTELQALGLAAETTAAQRRARSGGVAVWTAAAAGLRRPPRPRR